MQHEYLLQKEVLVRLHAHGVLVLAANLIQEPVQRIIVTFSIFNQTVPQDVHLFQTQSCKTDAPKHLCLYRCYRSSFSNVAHSTYEQGRPRITSYSANDQTVCYIFIHVQ